MALDSSKRQVLDLWFRWEALGEPRQPKKTEIGQRVGVSSKSVTRWIADREVVAEWRAQTRMEGERPELIAALTKSFSLAEELVGNAVGRPTEGAAILQAMCAQLMETPGLYDAADRVSIPRELVDKWMQLADQGDPGALEVRYSFRLAQLELKQTLFKLNCGTPSGLLRALQAVDPAMFSARSKVDLDQHTTVDTGSEVSDEELTEQFEAELIDLAQDERERSFLREIAQRYRARIVDEDSGQTSAA